VIPSAGIATAFALPFLAGCGEPMFEKACSRHSLLEDRKACAMEMEQNPAAIAYRQNPTAQYSVIFGVL
jgi:hypothetical protein